MNATYQALICPTCGKYARLSTRAEVGRGPKHLKDEAIYVCEDYPQCDTYVGCHRGTREPLGTMADRDLRYRRVKAHKAFDWAWTSKRLSRTEAYELLADVLGVTKDEAHIGMLDLEQCQKVIDAFNSFRPWKTPHR